MPYSTVPSKASLQLQPFKAHISDEDLTAFTQLLKLSKVGPKTYENLKDDRSLGINRQWLVDAKAYWESSYDWRKTEDRINSYPNFTVKIDDIDVHFLALFSKKPDAVPLALLHGWPGSFLEFVGVCDVLKGKYSEDDLPFHVVVPSLPGYGYSSGPPLDTNFTMQDVARIVDKLMKGLGFEAGYISQGGDIGSFVTRILASSDDFPACKAAHLNFCFGASRPEDVPLDTLSEQEKKGLARAREFTTLGSAYAMEHGTRPATIGLVLSSSPIALLAWIAEKFQSWTDTDPPLTDILDSVTLYWLTNSFPRAIYPYREMYGPAAERVHGDPKYYIKKPLGYSYFPMELGPTPKSWVARTGNLVWYREHNEGGHFAAMEKPDLFVGDMEDFIKEVWKS